MKQQSTPFKFSPIDGNRYKWVPDMTAERWRNARNARWLFNPWTGACRDERDIESDPQGLLIVPPGEPLYAEAKADDQGWIEWSGGDCPVAPDVIVDIKLRARRSPEAGVQAGGCRWDNLNRSSDIVAYRVADVKPQKPRIDKTPEQERAMFAPTAPDLLDAAAGHMRDRAATYDKPEGERSMGKTVEAFNAITGRDLRESEGWLLLALLKMVRSEQREAPHRDSLEDLIAYSALFGEARVGGR